jgi:hypothetical protein
MTRFLKVGRVRTSKPLHGSKLVNEEVVKVFGRVPKKVTPGILAFSSVMVGFLRHPCIPFGGKDPQKFIEQNFLFETPQARHAQQQPPNLVVQWY